MGPSLPPFEWNFVYIFNKDTYKWIYELKSEMPESAEMFHFGAKPKQGPKRTWQLWYRLKHIVIALIKAEKIL